MPEVCLTSAVTKNRYSHGRSSRTFGAGPETRGELGTNAKFKYMVITLSVHKLTSFIFSRMFANISALFSALLL